MTELTEETTSTQTLAQRMTEGKIPVAEGLRYAMILADALRKLHDEGRVHGGVAPCHIAMTSTGLELEPSRPTALSLPYAAPEVLNGQAADARSDIFSFATVLYELLTGRAPYQGKDRTSPLPSGSPAVDRLLASCLSLEPSGRPQRMQKVMLDLKLLSAAAARAAAPASAARATADVNETLRAEMLQMEARVMARLQAQEKKSDQFYKAATEALAPPSAEETVDVHAEMLQMETRLVRQVQAFEKKFSELQHSTAEALYREPAPPAVDPVQLQEMEARVTARVQTNEQAMAEMQRVANDTVSTLREQLTTVGTQLAAAQDRAASAEQSIEASGERVVARIQQSIDGLSDRIAGLEQRISGLEQRDTSAETARIEAIEQGLGAVRKQTADIHDLVAQDMLSFEQSLKAQAAAIESARTAMAQTDDLVERVVEALESLQSTVLEHAEDRAVAVN